MREIKVNDIFKADWEDYKWNDRRTHCFEGILIVEKDSNGELYLVDTFWGRDNEDNKRWKLDRAVEIFNLEFYVNMNDLERISEFDVNNYRKEDIFVLHEQHYLIRHYYKLKDAKKDAETKIASLCSKINDERQSISSSINRIQLWSAEIQKIQIEGL